MQKVKTLQNHIGKFGIADSALQASFYRFFVDHHIDIEMLSVIAQKINNRDILGPIQVIHHLKAEYFLYLLT